jgi:hypothetical protein
VSSEQQAERLQQQIGKLYCVSSEQQIEQITTTNRQPDSTPLGQQKHNDCINNRQLYIFRVIGTTNRTITAANRQLYSVSSKQQTERLQQQIDSYTPYHRNNKQNDYSNKSANHISYHRKQQQPTEQITTTNRQPDFTASERQKHDKLQQQISNCIFRVTRKQQQQTTTTNYNNKKQEQITTTKNKNKLQQQKTRTNYNNNKQEQITTTKNKNKLQQQKTRTNFCSSSVS